MNIIAYEAVKNTSKDNANTAKVVGKVFEVAAFGLLQVPVVLFAGAAEVVDVAGKGIRESLKFAKKLTTKKPAKKAESDMVAEFAEEDYCENGMNWNFD